ncbi:enoyl-CoA hydratase/isomerase family protein [Alphaproteobacteria bacterium]|nr:enoyl-CoA hydratase/isomerase family protein [Alphaproteobacteria bacterium]
MEIKFDITGSTGIIVLNRPKALNALNLSMAEQFSEKLREWQESDKVERVLLRGEGSHFCAGGDVKSVHLSGKNSKLKRDFFSKEYALNLQIKNFSKPYLCIWKGVVMGGGVGLSIYGDYRITTESTKFAMPETSIGFFPDVGGSFFLSKLENNIGKYLGLTSEAINCKDLLNFGIATHYCPEKKLNEFINNYISNGTITDYETTMTSLFSNKKLNFVNKNFSGNIFDIFNNLYNSNDPYQILNKLKNKCPMSMAVTAMLIENSKNKSLKECLESEYNLSQKMTNRHDFGEGIEAVLIKKHHNPKWQPRSIEEIDRNELKNLFASSIENKLVL